METNEIMNNEEVIEEATEEIVKAASRSGLKTATTIGLAMLAGGLACRFVVEPAVAKFKNWKENRKAVNCPAVFDDDFDEDFVEEQKDISEE